MNSRVSIIVAGYLLTVAAGATFAQHVESADAIASSDVPSQISMFSYRGGLKSDSFFRSTPTGALAEGTARVKYEDGHAEVSANADNLPAPGSLGPHAVYALWALTPDGRAVKQGVIAGFRGGKGKTATQYDGSSQFALIVTAEPHFAVTSPSTMELVQARYAVAIARQADAEQFAGVAYSTAKGKLGEAEMALEGKRHAERRLAPILAREAVVAAEDARQAAIVASVASHGETAGSESAMAAAVGDVDGSGER